jgi:hypothetical protein
MNSAAAAGPTPCARWLKVISRRDRPPTGWGPHPQPGGHSPIGCPLRSPREAVRAGDVVYPSELVSLWAKNLLVSTVPGSAGSGGCRTRSTKPVKVVIVLDIRHRSAAYRSR